MNNKDWMRMIRGGESLTIEFKRQVPKLDRLARSFSAFSNSSGGWMFFGIEDDGDIRGLDHVQGTRDLVEQVAQFNCDPPVTPRLHLWEPMPDQEVLVVEIPEAADKPVYAVNPNNRKDAWPYFRSDQENLPLDKQSIKVMRRMPSADVDVEIDNLDRHSMQIMNRLHEKPRQTLNQIAKCANISAHRAKKILVQLERNGWVNSYFNEKKREFSLTIPWKRR